MSKLSRPARIGTTACLLLAVLRIAIGWQFLYEGLWKLGTLGTPAPWSADGYLANSQGPFRETFRNLARDPDGLKKLDFNTVAAEWNEYRNKFVTYFQTVPPPEDRLTDSQVAEIDRLIEGSKEFTQPLAALPEGVDLSKFRFRKPQPDKAAFVKHDAASKRLVTNAHLLPEELDEFKKLAPKDDPRMAEYAAACAKLIDRSGKLGLKERLKVLLVEDRDRNGLVQEQYAGTVDGRRPGDVDVYKHLLDRYHSDLKLARVKFQQDHLQRQWAEIQERKGKLVGPVDALTAELQTGLYNVLGEKQFRYGSAPASLRPWVDRSVIWGLIVLGSLMLIGLCSRLSAFAGAVLLFSFYLAMPPLPGVVEPPGPDHSLIVNKNLIECLACLALATLPTGRWLGVDALVRRFVWRKTD